MKRSTTCWLCLVFAFGCGPVDHVGHDVISDQTAISAGAMGVSAEPTAGKEASGAAAISGAPTAGKSGALAASAGQSGAIANNQPTRAGESGMVTTGGMSAPGMPMAGMPDSLQGGAGAAADGGGPQDPECDLSGVWIARLTTFSRDSVFNSTQTASNWFYYEFTQHGREATATKALDCGIQVSGSADVTINSATTQALLHPNDQTGRRADVYKDGDHCTLKFTRWYSVRGAPRATYLAGDLSHDPALDTLKPALPTEQMPAGAEDWDKDGQPGVAFNVSGLGSRHVVQRDWNVFFSDASSNVPLSAAEFTLRADFDNQEQILAVSGGLGGLLRAGSTPAMGLRHRVLFRRLGRQPNDAGVTAIHGSDDLQTCFKVQDALPHDSASQ